ncbi:MAG TPA: cobyric acid synthase CobQ, partial [Ruminococcaceae bacterium]|nr:cobyric acid synthase CobQ [Oscillospiraceae bacterium]
SQVIVNGEVRGVMRAADYYRYKTQLIPDILAAYNQLAAQNDIIVLEGAGSPAEINLKENDIVNMGMAKMVQAPVLLVGDIDRGGVFAALAGTMLLLEEEEKKMVKGTIINKFRGDVKILEPGLGMLEDIIHIPTLGVVPYLHLDVDDEDSLTERFSRRNTAAAIDIAVIRLPRISNFTDFNPLEYMEQVSVRYVSSPGQLGDADLIILPGTKNTMDDLLWMRQNGLEAAVQKHAAKGKPVLGICGGFQMLGRSIRDPLGVEHGGQINGMGLLPLETEFAGEKTRTRTQGVLDRVDGPLASLSGQPFDGYEIHMGLTGTDRNLVNWKNVYGTYLHGIFDRPETAQALISALMREKGMDPEAVKALDIAAYKQRQYDILADGLRRSLDMDEVYRVVERGL